MPHKKFKFQYPKARYTSEQARELFFGQGLSPKHWRMIAAKHWWRFKPL